jgi:hypothetical protein
MAEEETRSETFERLMSSQDVGSRGPVSELRYLLGRNRKYWMLPIVLALLGVAGLIVLGGTAAAPLIYALF